MKVGPRTAAVLSALVLTLCAAQPSDARRPASFAVVRELGRGGNCKAYKVTHGDRSRRHLNVLKVIKERSKGRGVRHADAATRQTFAREAVATADLLRRNPRFRRRFGDIMMRAVVIEHEVRVSDGDENLVIPA